MISSDQEKELGKKFGFANAFPLAEKLTDAIFWKNEMERPTLTKAQQRKILKSALKTIEIPDQTISTLGPDELLLIRNNFDGDFLGHMNDLERKIRTWRRATNALRKAVTPWRNAIERTMVEIGQRTPGKRVKTPLYGFLFSLALIWNEGTGKKPKVRHKRNPDSYYSKFFDFVLEVLKITKVRYQSKSAVGKLSQRILKEYF